MDNLTNEQKDAINSDYGNIIVSAGAGSGKTKVLTHRVIRKLESGVSISELLILTFTNFAANEMKSRIKKAIKERIELSEELREIDNSYITTFDSFSLSLVKKYHYLLNVKKNVNIIESNLLNIKMKEFLDDIFEEEYSLENSDFIKLINDFCLKDDEDIKNTVLNINNELNLKYDKEEYLNNYLSNFYNDDFINNNFSKYVSLIKNIFEELNTDLTKISYLVESDYYDKLSSVILPIIYNNEYLKIKESVNNVKLPNLPNGSSDDVKKIKESIGNNIKLLKELTLLNKEDLINSIKLTKPYIEAITRIIKKLDKKISDYKYENDLYDFIDVCKMAIKLVKENESIREEIKNSFNEIMIDEYQDTSDLQEEFINLISNNNVYVVGDVKQSIYRFRNANPLLFQEKYNSYANGVNGKKIDLLKNFRSRGEVVKNINLIFNLIMSELIGGADYKTSHQMESGNISYLKEGKSNENNNLDIYSYDYDSLLGFNKEEIEAFIISNDIKNKVKEHFQIYDNDLKKLRDITYSDFAILIDRSISFTTFKKVFLYQKIPLSIYQDEKLTNSSLFMVIRNIFKLINLINDSDNTKEIEYTYLSIGRSFLSNLDDDYLFSSIINKTYLDSDIFNKIRIISNNIANKSISMVLDDIINEFDIYDKLRRIPDNENNYAKLDYLYHLANTLNKMGYNIKDFNKYLDSVLEGKMDIKFSINKEEGESVKIMTIHASKGLEYSVCYYPGLYKEFNTQDIKSKIIFSNILGIITPYYSEGISNSFYQELFKYNYYKDEVSEKIRLFYVALTRAKEKMIFVLPNTNDNNEEYENDVVSNKVRLNYRSFLDIINSIKSKLSDYIKTIDLEKLNITKEYNLVNSHNLFDMINKTPEMIKIIDYPKYESIIIDNGHFSKSSDKLFTNEEKDKMNFGTMMHYYLEILDFKNIDLEDIPSSYQEKIKAFLNCDLLKSKSKAKIYQEYEFIDENDTEKHGIIDLMLEYDDYIDIIDYKLKDITDEAYVKQLKGYQEYIKKVSNKKVNIYLYSLMDKKYKKLQ